MLRNPARPFRLGDARNVREGQHCDDPEQEHAEPLRMSAPRLRVGQSCGGGDPAKALHAQPSRYRLCRAEVANAPLCQPAFGFGSDVLPQDLRSGLAESLSCIVCRLDRFLELFDSLGGTDNSSEASKDHIAPA